MAPSVGGLENGEVLLKDVVVLGGANASHPENTDDDDAARSNKSADDDVAIIAKRLREMSFDEG